MSNGNGTNKIEIKPHTDNTDYTSFEGYEGSMGGQYSTRGGGTAKISNVSRNSMQIMSGGKGTTITDPKQIQRYLSGIKRERAVSDMQTRNKEKAAGVAALKKDIEAVNPTKELTSGEKHLKSRREAAIAKQKKDNAAKRAAAGG